MNSSYSNKSQMRWYEKLCSDAHGIVMHLNHFRPDGDSYLHPSILFCTVDVKFPV